MENNIDVIKKLVENVNLEFFFGMFYLKGGYLNHVDG